MTADFDRERLSELVALLCDDLITDEQFTELDEILYHSEDARRWYHVYVGMHRDLEGTAVQLNGVTPSSGSETKSDVPKSRLRGSGWVSLLAIAASVSFMIVGYRAVRDWRSADEFSHPEIVATVTHIANAEWDVEGKALALNDSVIPSRLRLKSGLIRLTYRHGVVLSLQGPADFEVLSKAHNILHNGQLAAYVPSGAEGFRVDTPSAGVVDLGTEFGMTVDDRGETQLSVFDGQVELTPSTPEADTTVVSSGHAYHVDLDGNAERLFELEPYKDARDSLRGWQIVWEPFGPGSETGPFPGEAGAGWRGEWNVQVENGHSVDRRAGVSDKQPLYPGAEFYLTVAAQTDKAGDPFRAQVTRDFGPIDQFTTSKPYTIELLLRVESYVDQIERIGVCGRPILAGSDAADVWRLEANRNTADSGLAWRIPTRNGDNWSSRSLPLDWWTTFRCFVEVDPRRGVWRATVASPEESISNEKRDAVPLTNSADGPMTLAFEVVGKGGKPIRFSIDGIRIQNHPDVKPTESRLQAVELSGKTN